MNKTNSSQSLIFGVPVYIIGQISRVLPHLFRGSVTLTLDFRIMCDLAKNFGCFRLGFSSQEKRSQAEIEILAPSEIDRATKALIQAVSSVDHRINI